MSPSDKWGGFLVGKSLILPLHYFLYLLIEQQAEESLAVIEEAWSQLQAEATEQQRANAERISTERSRLDHARAALEQEERSRAPVDNSEQLR